MKVFHRDHKINFVDSNNVLVGFDYSQNCCENFGYSILKKPAETFNQVINGESPDYIAECYSFDTTFNEVTVWGDEEYSVLFRLISPRKIDLYLYLYNAHNGYYSHGFTMQSKTNTIYDGEV